MSLGENHRTASKKQVLSCFFLFLVHILLSTFAVLCFLSSLLAAWSFSQKRWGVVALADDSFRLYAACANPSLTAKRNDVINFLPRGLIFQSCFSGLSSYDSNKHGCSLWHHICCVRHLAWGLFSAGPTELVHCVARVCGLLSRAPTSAVPLGAWMASCALPGWEQLAIFPCCSFKCTFYH